MDNERLNTILKLVAGLGSAGVSAISPAAGRAVLGGTTMWSNIEENERRKKEAAEVLSQRKREMEIKESEHEQGKRLSDVMIAQKQSEIEATATAKKYADELESSRKQRLADIRIPAALSDKDYKTLDEGPEHDAQVAALRGWTEFGRTIAGQQEQRTKMAESEKDRAARAASEKTTMERALAVAGISAGASRYGADQRRESAEDKPKSGAVNEDDIKNANAAISKFEDDDRVIEAFGGVKTKEDATHALKALLAQFPALESVYSNYLAAKRIIADYGPKDAGASDSKVLPPDKVDAFFKRNQ